MDKNFINIAKRFRTAAYLSMPFDLNKGKKTRIAFYIFEASILFNRFSKEKKKKYNWEELEEYDSSTETATELDGYAKIEGTNVDEWFENLARRVTALLSVSILKKAKAQGRMDWSGIVDTFYLDENLENFKKCLKDYLTIGGFMFKKEEDGKKYTLVKQLEPFKDWKEF